MKTAQSRAQSAARQHATATISVQSHESEPYDETLDPVLMELRLAETFRGDIEGDSTVRALQARGADGAISQVSLQRFRGKLGGRSGSFVLQGEGTVAAGRVKATWFVVPGSGTGDLAGLRGEGGFEGAFGKGSEGTLDYWFE
jgi:hypothetical protein